MKKHAIRKQKPTRLVFFLCHPVFFLLPLFFLMSLLLTSCVQAPLSSSSVTVLLEDDPNLQLYHQFFPIEKGSDLSVTVGIPSGQRIAGLNYSDYQISPCLESSGSYDTYTITLKKVRYPLILRVKLEPDYTTAYLRVFPNCASSASPDALGPEDELYTQITETSSRLRVNSLPYSEDLYQENYAAIGWKIRETGEILGFGSRFDHTLSGSMALETVYLPCTDSSLFSYRIQDRSAVITGFTTRDLKVQDLVLPAFLSGVPVKGIDTGAFSSLTLSRLVLPASLEWIAESAFSSLTVQDLYLYDTLSEVSDASFPDLSLNHLHLLSVRPPVYCGSYFDTLSEKIDYLVSVQNEPKLVLFCGSSARFGYNSPLLETYFPDRKVVNLGVYAYANMLPQARLMMHYLKSGDWVLSSPELDAIDTQFCGHSELDAETFAMMESNYDLFSLLDCREFTGLFDAFRDYQKTRSTMDARDYTQIPAHYDEDGMAAASLVYNRQGDYILYRESNLDRRLFGVKRACYNADKIPDADWDGLNRLYDALEAQGVRVFFTYSPRSANSITPDSTPETIEALGHLFKEKLHVPVISEIQDSLIDAFYFYGTDNHLTTQGADLHTRKTAEDLLRALEVTP